MSETKIALSEMIEQLREELSLAMAKGHGQPLRFEVDDVSLETEVVVERKAKAGIKLWIAAEAGGEAASSRRHKIVLKLNPTNDVGGKIKLGRPKSR